MVGASGELAQLGERQLCKLDVAGSIPAFSTAAMRRTKDAHEIRIRDTYIHHVHLHLLARQGADLLMDNLYIERLEDIEPIDDPENDTRPAARRDTLRERREKAAPTKRPPAKDRDDD